MRKAKHFLLMAAMLLGSVGASAETLASGSCGENLTWTLTEEGELVIGGTGTMLDFVSSSDIPWYTQRESVTKVTIQDGVTSIGNLAFYATNIADISIGKDVTSIGDDAFLMCRSLASISIPEGVTEIGNEAFYDCTRLTSVTLPSSLRSIDYSAFYGCQNLTSMSISEGLTSIGDDVFRNCISLSTITIPASVTSIGRSILYGCTNLTMVTCKSETPPSTYYSFDSSAPIAILYVSAASLSSYQTSWNFYFTNIKAYDPSGSCGDGVTWSLSYDGELIIEGAGAMTDYSSASSLPWADYIDRIKSVVVEDGVTRIGNRAFKDCTYLSSVKISESVESIGMDAFRRCSNLASIAIPESVMNIGAWAFFDCTGLHEIVFPEKNVVSIEIEAFDNTAWYNAQPDGVIYIGSVLYGYKGTMSENTNISVKEGTKAIAADAFSYCSNLVSIDIPEGVVLMGEGAFYNCSSLANINLPQSLMVIPSGVFQGTAWYNAQSDGVVYLGHFLYGYKGTMAANSSIVVKESITSIVDYAFSACWGNLVSITIPESIVYVGDGAFYGCNGLSKVGIDNLETWCNVTFVDFDSNPLYYAKKLYLNGEQVEDLVIPEGIAKVEEYAFNNCSTLNSVTIPEGVATIGEYAFTNCSASFICQSLTPPVVEGTYALYGNSSTLYIQEKAINAYQNADGWDTFNNIKKTNLSININQYGSATYCSEYALDFSEVEGLKAYAATGYKTSTGVITLTRVMTANAGVGLFLKGEPGEYTVPVLESTDENSLNMLVGTLESTEVNSTSSDGLYANFRYTIKDGDETPLFYRVDDGYTLGAGKAYLQIPVAWMPAEAKSISLRFDDGATTDIENDAELENQNSELEIYDLMGRRVSTPQRGSLYLINGKKIIY